MWFIFVYSKLFIVCMKQKKSILNESVLMDKLPDDIVQSLVQNRTSLGNNPAVPDIFDVPYLLKACQHRFKLAKDALKQMGKIDADGNTVDEVLSSLLLKCKKLEEPIRNELERICFNYVIDNLGVPEDSVKLTLDLTDEIDTSGEAILLDPIDGDDDFDDVEQAVSIRAEVFKRRMLDALCMGVGLQEAEELDNEVLQQISELNPELPELYSQILALNNYVLFTKEDLGMTDDNKMQLGTVEVGLGQEDEKVNIHAQGVIFPILICETFRGFFELFISHGLPSDMELTKIILGKADFLKAEPWDMRLGPHIWSMMGQALNDTLFDELPYLFKRVSSLDVDKFNFLMKELLAGTKKGKRIMAHLCNKAKNDKEYSKFVDKMDKMKADKGIITDDYIHADEL